MSPVMVIKASASLMSIFNAARGDSVKMLRSSLCGTRPASWASLLGEVI